MSVPNILSPSHAGKDAAQAAFDYDARGWKLVQVPFREKAAKGNGWQNASPRPDTFKATFNIGVQLGPKSGGLVDIDLDCPQAMRLADEFFPELRAAAFGRYRPDGSHVLGHRLVICSDIPEAEAKAHAYGFKKVDEQAALTKLGLPKSVVLEVRAGKGYTGFPPSFYGEDRLLWRPIPGDPNGARWDFLPAIPTMPFSEVQRRAGLLAFASLALAAYPGEGDRDNYCLRLAGALVHAGVSEEAGAAFIRIVAAAANDEDAGRRGDKMAATIAKKAEGGEVNGLPAFLEAAGLEACEKSVRKWLGMAAKTKEGKGERTPGIAVKEGDIKLDGDGKVARTDAMAKLLLDGDNQGGVYVRGEHLVRFNKSMALTVVTPTWLAHRLQEVGGTFYRTDKFGNDYYTDCNEAAVLPLMATADQRDFRKLTGVVRMATLNRNEPGWNPDSGLYGLFDKLCTVPLAPSRDEALAGLDKLLDLVRLYPFKRMDHEIEDPRQTDPLLEQNHALPRATRSVWLSGMLCASIRGDLENCPVHVTDAPSFGSGKTKLAQMWGLIATGEVPKPSDWDSREEENKKNLTALLSAGRSFILFDNLETQIRGKTLAACITSPFFNTRVLGYNDREMVVSTRALIAFSGVNVAVAADMVRRTVVCRVDHGVENPEDIKFPFDPVKMVEKDLDGYRAACLTIMRAYVAAGKPGIDDLPPDGSFGSWRLVRGALVWLGQADPWDVQTVTRAMDPELQDKMQVFVALYGGPGVGRHFIPWEIEQGHFDADGNVATMMRCKDRLASRLRDGQWSNKAVGRLLGRYRDQVFSGLVLRQAYDGRWRLDGKPAQAFLDLVEIL